MHLHAVLLSARFISDTCRMRCYTQCGSSAGVSLLPRCSLRRLFSTPLQLAVCRRVLRRESWATRQRGLPPPARRPSPRWPGCAGTPRACRRASAMGLPRVQAPHLRTLGSEDTPFMMCPDSNCHSLSMLSMDSATPTQCYSLRICAMHRASLDAGTWAVLAMHVLYHAACATWCTHVPCRLFPRCTRCK